MGRSATTGQTTATDASAPLDREVADQLVRDHLYLVQHIVRDLSVSMPRHVDREELWNAGAEGLVRASRRYDPGTGVPFSRYAVIRIRGAIIDAARDADFASRRVRRAARELRTASESLEARNGRTATADEIAEALGLSTQEVLDRQAAAARATVLRLDRPVGEDAATLGDLLRDPDEVDPQDALEHRELVGTLRAALPFLADTQADVLKRHYFAGEMLRDIADSMGVTEARVSQIHSEALNALRAYFGTAFDGVAEVEPSAPGVRRRAAFVAQVAQQTTWRQRLESAGGDARAAYTSTGTSA